MLVVQDWRMKPGAYSDKQLEDKWKKDASMWQKLNFKLLKAKKGRNEIIEKERKKQLDLRFKAREDKKKDAMARVFSNRRNVLNFPFALKY